MLDPADVGLQAEAAKAQVAATETEWKFAQAEYDRYAGLLKEKFISASALDAKRNALDANRAKYEQAKANLAVAQNQAAYATLSASDDGVITAVNADAGQVVTAGQPVFRLARAEEREVAISVPENRIGELTGAKQLFVVLWANPQKMYAAKVREVSPSVDAMTRTFAVRVAIANADPAVQWGMTANVGVLGDSAPNMAVLPPMSIYQQDGKPAVWRFDPATKQVNLTPVTIAQYREEGVVASGVRDGDWIVVAGVHKLLPGQVVRPYDDGPGTAAPEAALPAATAPAADAQSSLMFPANLPGGPPDTRFNLSEWSLRHRRLVLYLIVVFALIGFMSYEKLGQSEDPPFTFKVMVVQDQLARRDRAGGRAAGHRPHRTQAAGSTARRLGAQLLASRANRWYFSRSRIPRRPPTCPRRGTRCARRSATSATRCPPASRVRSSTTSSATSTPTSTR